MDRHEVLIDVAYSAISTGTETTIRKETSATSMLSKAASRLGKVKELGVSNAMKVFQKVWNSYQPLGYSITGRVIATGDAVVNVQVGDVVMATGAGHAIHADVVSVPMIYVCKVDTCHPRYALGGVMTIAVNAINKIQPRIADRIAIIGGGLIGELSAIAAVAAGARAAVIDIDAGVRDRLEATGIATAERLDHECDHIILCTSVEPVMRDCQDYIAYNGTICITGYGDFVLDRDAVELKQFKVVCVNSYGEFANNYFYGTVAEDRLATQYNIPTARQALEQSAFVVASMAMDSYPIVKVEDVQKIDHELANKANSTVIVDWS